MEFNVFVIKQHWPLLVEGAVMTFFICAASLALGCVLGAILCYGKMRRRGIFFRISTVIIDVFRTLPELVPIFWIYSAGPLIFDFRITAEGAGIVALTLYSGAFLAEIFRAGLQAVPRGQYEAANSLGIPLFWVYGVVISPQALRMMIPPLRQLRLRPRQGVEPALGHRHHRARLPRERHQRRDLPLPRDLHCRRGALLPDHLPAEHVRPAPGEGARGHELSRPRAFLRAGKLRPDRFPGARPCGEGAGIPPSTGSGYRFPSRKVRRSRCNVIRNQVVETVVELVPEGGVVVLPPHG